MTPPPADVVATVQAPSAPRWWWSSVLAVVCLASAIGWWRYPADPLTWALVPFTMLGNSLAMVPYDWFLPAYVATHNATIGVFGAVAATVLVEFWNMDTLARILRREGTAALRGHQMTTSLLHWFERAPWWTLVISGAVPVIPFYPCRFLALLAHYPMWRFQMAIVVGRGTRYIALSGLGLVLPISPATYFIVGLLMLLPFVWKYRPRTPVETEKRYGGE